MSAELERSSELARIVDAIYQTAEKVSSGLSVDHGGLGGLADDDHAQYLRTDGTRGLSADWDVGSHKVTAQQLGADIAIGTAPLIIASTTVVTNLNADLLDGSHAAAFAGITHAANHLTSGSDEVDGDKLEITQLLPYPNPFNPSISGAIAKFGFEITQRNINSLSLRIYTSGYRLVKEVVLTDAALQTVINRRYIEYAAEDLMSLANGTYYYLIIAEKDGEQVRSKIDKLIILK